MDLILILLGSLPLAHNAQHSLVIIAWVPGLPRFSNVCRLRIIKTRTEPERGRPGTEAITMVAKYVRMRYACVRTYVRTCCARARAIDPGYPDRSRVYDV